MDYTATFKNYVSWYNKTGSPVNQERSIRNWMEKRFLYEVILDSRGFEMCDVGEITNDIWSAYSDAPTAKTYYFFKSEVDAMAFKLKYF